MLPREVLHGLYSLKRTKHRFEASLGSCVFTISLNSSAFVSHMFSLILHVNESKLLDSISHVDVPNMLSSCCSLDVVPYMNKLELIDVCEAASLKFYGHGNALIELLVSHSFMHAFLWKQLIDYFDEYTPHSFMCAFLCKYIAEYFDDHLEDSERLNKPYLSLFVVGEEDYNLRANSLQEGGNDEDMEGSKSPRKVARMIYKA